CRHRLPRGRSIASKGDGRGRHCEGGPRFRPTDVHRHHDRHVPPVAHEAPVNRPRAATVADAAAIARLHATAIHEGFLAGLGPAFLRRLYTRVVRSEHAFALVVDDDVHGTCGFIAVAEHLGAFYREFLVHDGAAAAAAALPSIVRHPRHAWETLRYGVRGSDGAAPANGAAAAEGLSVGGDPAARPAGPRGGRATAPADAPGAP